MSQSPMSSRLLSKQGRLQADAGHANKRTGAGFHFATSETAQALDAQLLDSKASEYGTINHCAAQRIMVDFLLPRQVAHESAGETVARARRIADFFERICRHRQNRVAMKEHCAVFAALNDDSFRAHAENPFGRTQQIVLACKLDGFFVVD